MVHRGAAAKFATPFRFGALASIMLGALLQWGCGPSPVPEAPASSSVGSAPRPAAAIVDHPSASPVSTGQPPPSSALEASQPGTGRVPEIQLLTWKRALDKPCASIAVGKRRIAVLELGARPGQFAGVWMRDLREGGSFRALPFPQRIQPGNDGSDALTVYFGRDDRPRVMGTRKRGGESQQRYYRYKGNWRARSGEIGNLRDPPPQALFGILGHDDPEVVCKLTERCIIKRLTGWSYLPSPSEPLIVEIAGGSAFAVGERSALRLDKGDKAWRTISETVPWRHRPRGLWPFADGTLWVADGDALHRYNGKSWTTAASPLPGARRPWGRAPDDVWLAAEGGLAHFDGRRWQRLSEPRGDFSDVRGAGGRVWASGSSGVWIGTPNDAGSSKRTDR